MMVDRKDPEDPVSLAGIAGSASLATTGEAAPVRLLAAWRRGAGSTMARRCRPHPEGGRVLVVAVDDERWRREVENSRERLLASLRDSGLTFHEIRCIVQPASAGPPVLDSGRAVAPAEPAPEGDRAARLSAVARRCLRAGGRAPH